MRLRAALQLFVHVRPISNSAQFALQVAAGTPYWPAAMTELDIMRALVMPSAKLPHEERPASEALVRRLLSQLLARDPADRISASNLARWLQAEPAGPPADVNTTTTPVEQTPPPVITSLQPPPPVVPSEQAGSEDADIVLRHATVDGCVRLLHEVCDAMGGSLPDGYMLLKDSMRCDLRSSEYP